MVPSKTCIGVAEGFSAKTALEINIIYNGPLGYNYLIFCVLLLLWQALQEDTACACYEGYITVDLAFENVTTSTL